MPPPGKAAGVAVPKPIKNLINFANTHHFLSAGRWYFSGRPGSRQWFGVDISKYFNQILEINPGAVGTGSVSATIWSCVLTASCSDQPLRPAGHDWWSMIGNNSSGLHSHCLGRYGLFLSHNVLLHDGSKPNLKHLQQNMKSKSNRKGTFTGL